MGFVAAAMGVVSLIQAHKAGSAADRSAKKEAALNDKVTKEKIALIGQDKRRLAGETRAAAAGSGVNAGRGSVLQILAEQARTFDRESAFTTEVGAEKSGLIKQRGRNVASAAKYQGFSSALASFGQAAQATAQNKSFFGFG